MILRRNEFYIFNTATTFLKIIQEQRQENGDTVTKTGFYDRINKTRHSFEPACFFPGLSPT
jgi:hypothetical protein